MITVRDRVEDAVKASPYLNEALAQGLINVSSLARQIHPTVAHDLRKPITVDAVFMALKRYAATLEREQTTIDPSQDFGDLALRTDLFQITVANSERLISTLAAMLNQTRPSSSTFFTLTKGPSETSITASQSLHAEIETWMVNEKIISRHEHLTAVSVQRLSGKTHTPVQYPLQLLAWHGISVIDVASTSSEVIALLNDADVDRAIKVLRDALRGNTAKSAAGAA